ncbi:Sirohydrochlorin ferrochelatase [Gloeomargarita lithophora Alchichica-D10]|uniref:Sirohydrochlorin ferrochelatase n=1 Tax=Gloeomargarita lithophora Alchichica-D10 TaxID=1188229 RepID=A0A1J0AG20_9CYAN|nr:sirohydrochlorin chelatase [Gloeomargarita lithophora]APB34851.1 Sirohydrochlorin ferrochelatase [Gloeomargarita lithophora Alchichica-D10]
MITSVVRQELCFTPLPQPRPLLLIGHGTRDNQGRADFLDFAQQYGALDSSRPVIPCFLELTEPLIEVGISTCIEAGWWEVSAVPLLLLAARHLKLDITRELDRARSQYPGLKIHYGRHLGLAPEILALWQERLTQVEHPTIPRSETVVLLVGRGASDPDANSDTLKLARLLWEGSGYLTVETCFIGITHPRLEEGWRRVWLYQPQRVIVLPHFLFTGVLVQKIQAMTREMQAAHPQVDVACLNELGITPELFSLMRQREWETYGSELPMNCDMCKFRQRVPQGNSHSHSHADHHHSHDHGHSHPQDDPYQDLNQYHQRIWQ